MPRKPRKVQDRVDQLIKEKYTTKEIIEKIKEEGFTASASYISSRRKKIPKTEAPVEKAKTTPTQQLSKESFHFLFNLMGMLETDSFDETIQTIYNDYKTILSAKYRYDINNERGVSEVFNEFEASYRFFNKYADDVSDIPLLIKRVNEYAEEEVLIINLTRNWPWKDFSVLERLRNGVATWNLRDLLMELYPDEVVQNIVDGLNEFESRGQVFQVTIKNMKQVSIFPLTMNSTLGLNHKIK